MILHKNSSCASCSNIKNGVGIKCQQQFTTHFVGSANKFARDALQCFRRWLKGFAVNPKYVANFVNKQTDRAVTRSHDDIGQRLAFGEALDNAVNIAAEVFESRERLRESGRETALNVLEEELGVRVVSFGQPVEQLVQIHRADQPVTRQCRRSPCK